nr:hypothetical protein OJAV_G00026640 [Ipomoea batatas]
MKASLMGISSFDRRLIVQDCSAAISGAIHSPFFGGKIGHRRHLLYLIDILDIFDRLQILDLRTSNSRDLCKSDSRNWNHESPPLENPASLLFEKPCRSIPRELFRSISEEPCNFDSEKLYQSNSEELCKSDSEEPCKSNSENCASPILGNRASPTLGTVQVRLWEPCKFDPKELDKSDSAGPPQLPIANVVATGGVRTAVSW